MKNIFILFICLFIFAASFKTGYAQFQAVEEQPSQPPATGSPEAGVPEFALADKPLEIWTFIDDYRIITGKMLHLTVQVLWKLGVTVDLKDINKINLSPFIIEGVTVSERQIFDNEHDYVVVTYTLSLPPDIKEGIYTIPSFSISYRNEVDKTEGKADSPPIAVKKVPLFVEGKVDRDVITLGDQIHYNLTIYHENNVKVLWDSISKFDFSPFEVLKEERELQTEEGVTKIHLTYTISLYDLIAGKKPPEIPDFAVLYYVESESEPKEGKEEGSVVETREAKTTPIPIMFNSLLKAVDVPLEGIKGPVQYSRGEVFFNGHLMMGVGLVLLVFLGVITFRTRIERQAPVPAKPGIETPHTALERLKKAIVPLQIIEKMSVDPQKIHDLDKAFRTYLGTLMGISNETAMSTPTSHFLNLDTRKTFADETIIAVQSILKQLDKLIFGKRVDKETLEDLLQRIEEIIHLTRSHL